MTSRRRPRSRVLSAAVWGCVAVAATLGATAVMTPVAPPDAVFSAERTIRTPGTPTLHVVDLSAGQTLQFYLDPGTPGLNAIHATYFDAQGRELQIARVITIEVSRRDGSSAMLPVLQEGPGHFYSDFDFRPGEWLLEIVATTRTGRVVRVHVTLRL